MFDHMCSLVESAIVGKLFPGCVIGHVQTGGERRVWAFGNLTYETRDAVREDTLYDLASVTKSIPLASLAAKLIDEGRLSLEDRLVDHVPAFTAKNGENITVRHLLTYTIPPYPLFPFRNMSASELAQTLLTHEVGEPGSAFAYANLPAYLLGLIVESVAKLPLDALAKREFFDPLNMTDTTFAPRLGRDLSRIAPSERDGDTELRGIVHDESARVFAKAGKAVGHAGLFSTAPNLLIFLDMLLCGGMHAGRSYLSETAISSFETNQIPELGKEAGLGWELHQPWMGKRASARAFGKTGFTGTSIVVDRAHCAAWVILSNRRYPLRRPNDEQFTEFRRAVADIILA